MGEVPGSRRFGNTNYRFRKRTEKKGPARKEVRRIRKTGKKARLVKFTAYDVYSAPRAKPKKKSRK